MRNKLLLLLLLLLPAWVAWAQAPVWQSVSGLAGSATTVRGSALAANGDYYIVGSYTGSADFGNGKSLTSSDQTFSDGFLARINGTTNLCTWVVSMGGTTGGDEVRGVAVSGSTVYITGYYSGSASFSNTSNAGSQPLTAVINPGTGTGSIDVFVAKYDENGNPLGSISGGGTSSDQGYSIAVSGTNIYVTGFISTNTTTSTNVKFGTVTLGNNGGQDMFVARFTDNGTLAHGGAQSGGGTGLDRGNAIGVGTNGIYVAGYFTGAVNATISNSTFTGAGSNDLYVAKFTDTGSGLNNGGAVRSGGANSDQATALTVSGTNIYVGGFFNQNATPGTTATVSISGSTLSSDNRDLFLAKYTDSGAGLGNGYAIRDGSANPESVGDLALSGSTVYVVGGYTTAANIAGSPLTSNSEAAYVAKYTDTGATFSAVGAIDGGPDASTISTAASTVSVSGNQVVLGGFLGSPATFTPASTGSITVPAGNSGFFAKLAQAPVLASISPNIGPAGTSVTLTGTNLTGTTVVTFSGTSNNTVASVTVNGTGTQTITVNVPTGATTGNVTVTTPAGTSNGVAFTVQQPTTVASIVRASTNPTNSTTVNYTVTFGAPVTGLTASNFSLTTTGTVSGATVGTPVASTGNAWTVPVNTGTGSGTLTLNLANDTNLSADVTTTLPFAGETYTIDKTAPAAPVVTAPANGSSLATTTPTYTGTSEANATVTVLIDGFSIGTTTASNSGNWSLAQPTALAQGSHTVRATATDAAGNISPNSGTNTFTVDTVRPTATITSSGNTNGGTTNTTPIPFTVTFTENVTGFVQGDVSVTNGSISGFTAVNGMTYNFNVTPTTPGTATTVGVPANVAVDPAGNGNTSGGAFSVTYQQPLAANSQAVTVNLDANGNGTLTASSVNNNSTGSGTLTYTIQKIAFGYIAEGTTPLTLTTPNGANFIQIRFASYGTPNNSTSGNYSLGSCNAANSLPAAQNAYVGRSSGSLYASNTDTRNNPVLGDPCGGTPKALAVQAGYSADAASLTYDCTEAGKTQYVLLTVTNGTSTSTSVAQVTVNAPPTATISSVSPTSAQRGATVTVAGTNLSGVSSVTVNGAAATVSNPTANGFTFVVPSTATFGTGSILVATPCAQTLTNTFTVVAPALTATVSTTSASPTSTSPIPFSVTFSQSVGTTFTASDVTVAGGTVNSGSFSGSGAGPYTFTITPSGAGTVIVSLAANVANDANNTGNSASNSVSVQYQAPTITVAPASLPIGTQNTAYSQNLSASGGTAPYTFVITARALPPGLTLTSAGVLSGTPTASGTFNFTITVTDASAAPGPYSGSRDYSLVINAQPVTAAPVVTTPNGFVSTGFPTYSGTAAAGSLVTVYVNNAAIGATTATGTGSWSLAQPTRLADGVYTVYATAQSSGSAVSANSTTNTFVIDTVSPTVTTSSSAAANGGTSSTSPLAYTVTFSEAVTGFVAGDVTVGNGTISGFAGSGTTYTFNVTPSANGTVTVDIPVNVAQDRAGNGNNAASQYRIAYARLVTAAPVITSPANGSLTNQPSVTFSGTAPAGSTVELYVSQNNTAYQNLGASAVATAAGTFTYTIPNPLPDAVFRVYATAQSPGADVSANSSLVTFTVDQTRPSVAIGSTAGTSGGNTSTSPIPFTVTFSETVTGFVAGDVTVTNGTISGFTGSGASYSFNVTPTTAGTATTVNVPANVAQDAASNGNTAAAPFSLTYLAPSIVLAPASLPGGTVATAYSATFSASGGTAPYTYTVSGTLPTGLTLSSAGVLSGTPTASGSFTFTVTATDASAAPGPYRGSNSYTLAIGTQAVTATPVVLTPANGFVSTKFPTYSGTAVANSTVTVIVDGASIGTTTADGSGNWRLTASSPLAEGSHTVRATAQASGQAVSASSTTITFVVDTISPSVTISSSTAPSGSTSGSAPFAYTVTFSENVTGFVAGDVTVSNGTVSGFAAGSGTTYTFNVTPAANGVVTVDVPVNVAQDAAGNGNNAATQYVLTYQQLVTAAPVVTTPANGALVSTTTPTYSGTAAAGATVTVFVDNLSIGTATAAGGSWTLVQPTALAQGTHTVRATAQLGGQAMSASSSTNTFTVDTVSPTITLGSTATNPTSTSPIPVTVTFSESVTGFGASSVTVTNGTLSGFSGSGSLYTFSVTPSAAGTVTVNIAANVAQDAAGNGNVAATQFSINYVVPVTATTWTGAVSTDWFTAGNWTAGVPTITVDATIPASAPRYPLVTAGTASVKSLSINSGASISQSGGTLDVRGNLTNNGTFGPTGGTVALGASTQANILGSSSIRFWNLSVQTNGVQLSTSAGASVQRVATLVGSLTTNGNTFTLLSGSTGDALVVNSGGVVAGTATVQRYIDPSVNAGLGARHYSAPVSNTTVADLATSGYTPVLNPAFNTADKPAQVRPFPTVFGYDQSRLTLVNTLPTFDKGFFSPASFSDPLRVGQGYVVNIASTELVDFVGTLNNGDVTTNMASNRDTYTNDGGWQFLGNPYPAPLDYSRVAAADRAGLEAAMYVYSSTSQYQGTYRAYANGIGNPVLPVGQGFFTRVATGQASGTLIFRNSQRLTAPNGTTFQRTTAETRPLVQLTLKGASSTSDDAYVYFENGATNALDAQFDAVKMPNTTGLNLSTSITGQQLAIDGRPELGKAQQVVPLAVGVPTVGTYTFTTAQLLNLANVPVYLRDLQLGTVTDLRLQPSYQFTVTNAAALITGRFELVFSPQQALATVPAALAQQVALYPNPAKKAAFVELPASLGRQAVTATFVDALGRQVRTVQLPAQGSVAHPLDLSDLATGVYALRLSTSAGVVVKKLVVE